VSSQWETFPDGVNSGGGFLGDTGNLASLVLTIGPLEPSGVFPFPFLCLAPLIGFGFCGFPHQSHCVRNTLRSASGQGIIYHLPEIDGSAGTYEPHRFRARPHSDKIPRLSVLRVVVSSHPLRWLMTRF